MIYEKDIVLDSFLFDELGGSLKRIICVDYPVVAYEIYYVPASSKAGAFVRRTVARIDNFFLLHHTGVECFTNNDGNPEML